MSSKMHRAAFLAATALTLSAPLAPRALAASPPAIDAPGAQAIVDAVHALLVEMFGSFAPAATMLHATVQGDHYRVELPIAHRWKNASIGGDSIGANLVPLGDGRWQLSNGTMPGRLELDVNNAGVFMPKAMVATVKDFTFGGVIDTTLATESKITSAGHGFATTSHNQDGQSEIGIASLASALTVSPAQDGRVVLTSTDTEEGISNTTTYAKSTIHSSAKKASGSLKIEGLSLSAVRAAFHTLSTMPDLPPPSPGKATDQATSKQMHAFIAALADSMTGMTVERTEDGIAFEYPEVGKGSLEHAAFDLETSDKGGQASLALGFGMQGLSIPSLPPGSMTTFLPKRAVIHIALSGLDSATLHQSLDQGVDDPSPDAALGLLMGALAAHPATVAIDKFAVETGPATITAHGKLTTTGQPDHTTGEAVIRATGFDAAMKELQADPQAKDIMPQLIFAKGLAKQDGDALVWNITFDGQKLLVNGTDLFGGPPKP